MNSEEICSISEVFSSRNENKIEVTDKCREWLDSCSIKNDSESSDVCETSSVFSDTTDNSGMASGLIFQNDDVELSSKIICQNNELNLETIINKDNKRWNNINIYKSRKVHIGDVTYVNGPVIVNNTNSADNKIAEDSKQNPLDPLITVPRKNWLAQPALGKKEYLKGPAKFVIISHTATEEAFTQAENTLLIRLIQTFHIESRQFDDIAYNFIIGSDGNVYEGRGWGVIGAHTRLYNEFSLGISFVGCFIDHLPPSLALRKVQALIEHGVNIGAVSQDYVLLAHCQCSGIQSPGKRLYEEIKSWGHWDESIDVKNPPLVIYEKKLFMSDISDKNLP